MGFFGHQGNGFYKFKTPFSCIYIYQVYMLWWTWLKYFEKKKKNLFKLMRPRNEFVHYNLNMLTMIV